MKFADHVSRLTVKNHKTLDNPVLHGLVNKVHNATMASRILPQ